MHGYGILNFSIKYFSVKYIFSFLFLCSIMNIMASTQQITDPSNNIFQQVLTNASGVQDRILGPTYPYYNNIKSMSESSVHKCQYRITCTHTENNKSFAHTT